MPPSICEVCTARPAVVLLTQTVKNSARKRRFCEKCARAQAASEGWTEQLAKSWADQSDEFFSALRDAAQTPPLATILLQISDQKDANEFETDSALNGDFGDAFESDDFASDAFESDDFAVESTKNEATPSFFVDSEVFETETQSPEPLRGAQARCPECSTTWDTLKRDGRAGCATCYETFRAALTEVITRVQHAQNHSGKVPRAAQKRGRRVQNLQTRRENQLQLLQSRLETALAAQNYKEAAGLRDKIQAIDD